jgi:putative transposase
VTKFKDKYRVESTRLPGWDYSQPGWYFVTICTRDRHLFFGDVADGTVCLSPIGEIVAEEWQKTPQIRPNVELDEWVVMPNHVHGIIVITAAAAVETPRRGVSTGSLGAIVGQIKSVCTKRIWAAGYTDFGWQSRFYDRIIRDEMALARTREYIRNNPLKWERDRNNPANVFM